MSESNVGDLIERYAAGTASEREIERLESLAAADPSVALLMRAEVGIRHAADVRQASLGSARPEPSPLLMDMLRRTPPVPTPVIPSASAPLLVGGRGIMMLIGTLLVGIVIGSIWVAPTLDADSKRSVTEARDGQGIRADSVSTQTSGAAGGAGSGETLRGSVDTAGPEYRGGGSSARASSSAARGSRPVDRTATRGSRSGAAAQGATPTNAAQDADEPLSIPRGDQKVYVSDSMKVRIEMRSSGGK